MNIKKKRKEDRRNERDNFTRNWKIIGRIKEIYILAKYIKPFFRINYVELIFFK